MVAKWNIKWLWIVLLSVCLVSCSQERATATTVIDNTDTSRTSSIPENTKTLILPTEPAPPTSIKALIPTSTPRPTDTLTPFSPLSGGGDVLTFVRTSESGWVIFVINADGSEQRRLLFHSQALAYPEWSPDGRQIAFHKHISDPVWSIYVMDADGRHEKRLTNTNTRDATPVWSPDGFQIAFTRGGDIWIMSADGSDQRLLLDDPSFAYGVDWSPDGSQIVFVSERDGNEEVYVVNANGDDLRRLTHENA